MGYTENAKLTLDGIVEYVNGDGVAKFVEKSLFLKKSGLDIPATKWSALNRLAILSRTENLDCRGFQQWIQAGRIVKKGAKAAYILVPMIAKDKEEESKQGEEAEKKLIGFRCVPVFPSDMTEGEPLPYETEALDLTKLPLKHVADHLGLKVSIGITVNAYGFFRPDDKQIVMGTDDMTTWLHELGHAIDNELPNKSSDYDFNEIVAELTSATLCRLMDLPGHIEHTKAYIKMYSKKGHVAHAIAKAVERVGQIFEYIDGLAPAAAERKVA